MTEWVPAQSITVKVLGLAWLGERLLLGEVEDSVGRSKGFRPLGGSVEFGETREEALRREFMEELGWSIRITSPWHAFENIFVHEGTTGHEYVFVANVAVDGREPNPDRRIRYNEADGTRCQAGWFVPSALPHGLPLYPEALAHLVATGQVTPTT